LIVGSGKGEKEDKREEIGNIFGCRQRKKIREKMPSEQEGDFGVGSEKRQEKARKKREKALSFEGGAQPWNEGCLIFVG